MLKETTKQGQTEGPKPGDRPDLPKSYRPADHESRILQRWLDSGAFHADPQRVLTGQAGSYCILIPPPNVTDRLHLGHALNNTLQDVLARAHRMMGLETLWMPGTDHAGIATQAVVERRVLKEEGKRRSDFSREEFVKKIQAFKDEYEATITGQLKAMGCSCDWARQRFTMDPICARAVSEAFFRLFKDGLIYRGKRLVNWDPVLQTAVADDETEDVEIDGHMYYLRYPLVHPHGAATTRELARGRSGPEAPTPVTWSELRSRGWPAQEDAEHSDEKQAWVTVATTRPETYLGDTAVAVNPKDPRAKALRGLCIELPLVGRIIPVIEDDYVVLPAALQEDPDAAKSDPKAAIATGFLKVTPAHDPNDYEIGQRHSLAQINVLAPDASISDKHGWTDVHAAHIFVGKTREEARKLVIREFKDRTVGGEPEAVPLFAKSIPYKHTVPHSDRSKSIIEPYLSDQWYVKVTDERLAPAALRAMAQEQRSLGGAGVPPAAGQQGAPDSPAGWQGGAGVPPAAESSARSLSGKMPVTRDLRVNIRRLPHFQRGGSTYFVTFRLLKGQLSEAERQIVVDACMHWHMDRAVIGLVTVMPDHVHLLFRPLEKPDGTWYSLGELLHSIKSFTSHEIAKFRGRKGNIWQDEWFDRLVEGQEFEEKWQYMLNNPVKAGLVERAQDYRFSVTPDTAEMKRLGATGGGRDARPTQPQNPFSTEHSPGDGELTFYPDRYAKTFETWHENIRDWCISRQLWWGHRIPVWSCVDASPDAIQWAGLHVKSGAVAIRAQDRTTFVCLRSSPNLEGDDEASAEAGMIAKRLEIWGFTRDPDVLDTWFSSALWPMSTMGWPDPDAAGPDFDGLLEAFNPSSTLCTAREIITLWVSRMVMFNRYFMGQDLGAGPGRGPVPFRDVFIHAMIQDGDGRKMSKSLGNGVDPLDIIVSHGADAMRYTLVKMTTQTQDVRMPVAKDPTTGRNTSPKFDEGRNLANKLWQASTGFALSKLLPGGQPADLGAPRAREELLLVDRWMLSRLQAGLKRVNAALKAYEFNEYAEAVYQLLWWDFCDVYVEAIKPTIAGDPMQRAVLAHALEVILRLLHPIAPYVTEAVWERLRPVKTLPIPGINLAPSRKGDLLCTAGWPEIDPSLCDQDAEFEFARVKSLIDAINQVRANHKVLPKRRVTLHCSADIDAICRRAGGLVEALAMVDRITSETPTGPAAAFAVGAEMCSLSNLADQVDEGAERARLEKVITDCDKSIATLEGRLANPGYADRAPPAMVQETRDQLAKAKAERDAAAEALRRLG